MADPPVTADAEKEYVLAVYEQLSEHVRKQDELAHSWTKFHLEIQAALAVALSVVIRLDSAKGVFADAGGVFIPLLGLATSVYLTRLILREQLWQGRYIAQIRRLPHLPETFRKEWSPPDPDPETPGYIGRQFLGLRNVLVAGWILWLLSWVFVTGYGFFPVAATVR